MLSHGETGFIPLPPRGARSIIHVHDLARLLSDLVDAPPAMVRHRLSSPTTPRGGWSHQELAKAIGHAIGRQTGFRAPILRLAEHGSEIDGWLRSEARMSQTASAT